MLTFLDSCLTFLRAPWGVGFIAGVTLIGVPWLLRWDRQRTAHDLTERDLTARPAAPVVDALTDWRALGWFDRPALHPDTTRRAA